ncbi:MAG TPA: type II toxin-antitoxin system VapC family toxin [Polyangiaceae bacterium]
MKAYIDASVLLRIVLGEPGALRSFKRVTRPISSELIRLECLRTIDRARLRRRIPDSEVAERRGAVLARLESFDLVRVGERVLERAAEQFPTTLGSLDAVHLATALLVRGKSLDLAFATHDAELAIAARAVGFRVLE